jgi:hypothetical protein
MTDDEHILNGMAELLVAVFAEEGSPGWQSRTSSPDAPITNDGASEKPQEGVKQDTDAKISCMPRRRGRGSPS